MNDMLPPHLAYLASAGSGKTYRLAHRVIHLLALGVEPGAICALTFSRKAAGEIFESVVKYLVEAAEDDRRAAATAGVLGLTDRGRDAFRDCLRAFLDGMHRSPIGTIDSFIHGVAHAFACELGVASTFEVMDGAGQDAQRQRAEVLDRILQPAGATREQLEVFLEAFRQATYGKTEKNFLKKLNGIVGAYQPAYQSAPEAERWSVSAVWPDGFPFAPPSDAEAERAAEMLRAWAAGQPDAAKVEKTLGPALDEVEAFAPGNTWPDHTPFNNACAAYTDLARGRAEFNVAGKKRTFAGLEAAAWAALIRRVAGGELERRLRMTAGIFQILERFERDYQAEMRLTGRMTFDDLTRLLAGGAGGGGLTCEPGRADRLFIDYRLDARIRHWLLDEFQDTSDLQWSVLGNLVDEVMQDASGERRFFCVGDVKQAIYGWRGGNARLFGRLIQRYIGRLHVEPLPESFRSCPAVIDAVNRLFGDVQFGEVIPESVEVRWSELWETHTVAERNLGLSGCTAVIDTPLDERVSRGSVLAAVLPSVCALLRRIDPPARGLDCAILVRSNDEAAAVVEHLRAHLPGMPVLLEGQSGLTDCPAVGVLLAALRAAFHPADEVAEGVVRMSPLGGLTGDAAVPPAAIRREYALRGAVGAAGKIWAALSAAAAPDAFAAFKMSVLLELAADFDAAGGGTPDEFDALVREHEFGDRSAAGAVRVMTIHKSKGLGFDLVLLPGLSASGFAPRSRGATLLHGGEETPPDWILHKPVKEVCALDPALAAAAEKVREDGIFEELCLFYVATTRSRRGLYLFTASGAKPDVSKQGGYVLAKLDADDPPAAFEGPGRVRRVLGDWDWHEACPRHGRVVEAVEEVRIPAGFAGAVDGELEEVEPSAAADFVQDGDRVFDPESTRVLDFGTHMHALFERVEWLEEADPEALLADWRREAGPDAEMDASITPQFRACFGHPDFRRELARPAGRVELWREKRFEIVLDGQWMSGTFDRVVLTRGEGGEVASAVILDYKTNRVADAAAVARTAEHYAGQMGAYRRALSAMLGLPADRIRAVLLFTVPGVSAGMVS
jgi:ATP-dependent helicase/nuclease subunit A